MPSLTNVKSNFLAFDSMSNRMGCAPFDIRIEQGAFHSTPNRRAPSIRSIRSNKPARCAETLPGAGL
ncbi:hypothetical protein BGZ61DRAFT_467477, partial [Ilyonectria robusta]|uniref:uncharacterized protein n=1 Tax=Ilyonectria robusta TaxID=1079257 RepID=UPI001E8E418B